jgi:acyl carrier protein
MDQQEVRSGLVEFLRTVATPGCNLDDVDDSINLIDAGMIDSFALIQVIFYLEQNHGCDLHALGIDPADLCSIKGILSAIQRAGN